MGDFPGCGSLLPPGTVQLESGGTAPFFLTGTDPDIGGTINQVVDMTTEVDDFIPSETASDHTFMICIETAAPIEVQLANGNDFTITLAQATANLGFFLPYKIQKVYKAGTTGTFSVGR